MALQEILVPDIGEYSNVDVIDVLVKVGDRVAVEDSLVSLETDKATMEVPSPMAGVVKALAVKVGDKVSEGSLILKLETEDSKIEAPKVEEAKTQASPVTESAASTQTITVPDIGEYSNVDVIEVHVKAGDTVQAEDPLLTLETDKATMDIPAPFAGKITEVKVKVGDKISQGDAIAETSVSGKVTQPAEKSAEVESPAQKAQEAPKPAPMKAEVPVAVSGANAHASPGIRRLARELGVDITQVSATGRKGRILEEDLKGFVKRVMQSQGNGITAGAGLNLLADPVVDFAKFGDIETVALSRIKKISGANLARNWVKIPHITLFEEADITDLEAFRHAKKAAAEKQGLKLTPVAFIVKAVAKALVDFPNMNASLAADGENLIVKKYVHVGVAVDTPNGLMVPVIRHADKKGLFEIAADLASLAKAARDGKLKPSEMQGGCFTISSLGGVGTTAFTPIVNMPEVGILGVSKAAMKPIYDGKGFVPRLMLPLSLSVDHRVVDGAEGAQFVVKVAGYLADLRELLL